MKILSLSPCSDAVAYLRTQPSLRAAWDDCERSDWLVWLVCRAHDRGTLSRQRLVQCCLRWIEPVCYLLPNKSITDLGVVARWTVGAAIIENVRETRDRLWRRYWSDANTAARATAAAAAADAAAAAAAVAAAAAAARATAADAAAAADVVRASITLDEVCAALDLDPEEVVR